jgi:hypothetical protein
MRVPPTAGYLSVARLALLHAIAGPLGAASGFIWMRPGCVQILGQPWQPQWLRLLVRPGKVLYIAILGITWWTITGSRGPICGHCDQKVPVSLLVLVLHVHDNDPWNNARQKEMLLYGLVSIAACKSLNLQVCKVPKAPFQPKTECFSYFNLNHFGII